MFVNVQLAIFVYVNAFIVGESILSVYEGIGLQRIKITFFKNLENMLS